MLLDALETVPRQAQVGEILVGGIAVGAAITEKGALDLEVPLHLRATPPLGMRAPGLARLRVDRGLLIAIGSN